LAQVLVGEFLSVYRLAARAITEQWRYACMMKMMTSWCGVMIIVSVGGGRRAVGGGLVGRLVVAAGVMGGGTNRGTKVLDGGGPTNGRGVQSGSQPGR